MRIARCNFGGYISDLLEVPILWDQSYLSLLVAICYAHVNPIFSRCWFTLASNSTTWLTICGSGVS